MNKEKRKRGKRKREEEVKGTLGIRGSKNNLWVGYLEIRDKNYIQTICGLYGRDCQRQNFNPLFK